MEETLFEPSHIYNMGIESGNLASSGSYIKDILDVHSTKEVANNPVILEVYLIIMDLLKGVPKNKTYQL